MACRARPPAPARDGTTWTIQPTPTPAGATGSYLQGVSCTAAGACTAAGNYTNAAGTMVTLAEARHATAWTIQPTPNPAGAISSHLSGVSCPTASACTAVGTYTLAPGETRALAIAWDGTTWTSQPMPSPSGAPQSRPAGVSCTSASTCTAAGYRTRPSGLTAPLAETEH